MRGENSSLARDRYVARRGAWNSTVLAHPNASPQMPRNHTQHSTTNMSPTKANALAPSTTTDLAAIAMEVAKSVTAGADVQGHTSGQSKRAKHVEKTKLQHVSRREYLTLTLLADFGCFVGFQLTKQLAMRLQYAKLKVDHGWVSSSIILSCSKRFESC